MDATAASSRHSATFSDTNAKSRGKRQKRVVPTAAPSSHGRQRGTVTCCTTSARKRPWDRRTSTVVRPRKKKGGRVRPAWEVISTIITRPGFSPLFEATTIPHFGAFLSKPMYKLFSLFYFWAAVLWGVAVTMFGDLLLDRRLRLNIGHHTDGKGVVHTMGGRPFDRYILTVCLSPRAS